LDFINFETRKLPHHNAYPVYHPHITLAYVAGGQGELVIPKLNQILADLSPNHMTNLRFVFSGMEKEIML